MTKSQSLNKKRFWCPVVFVGSLQSTILLYGEHWHYYGQSISMPVELARMPTAHFAHLNAHRTGFYECVLRCFQCFDLILGQLFKQRKGRQWFFFWRENSLKGDTASKIWRKWPVFWETNRQTETVLKFLGENVTTGPPVDNNFNGQIMKLSPFMSPFDLGFWQPLATLQIWKNPKKNPEGRARQYSFGFGYR